MPPGYGEDEGICGVTVASYPNMVNVKDPLMYKTCQEHALSSVYAPIQNAYTHNSSQGPNKSKMTTLDVILSRREEYKCMIKSLDEDLERERKSVGITLDPPTGTHPLHKPSDMGFSKTVLRLRNPSPAMRKINVVSLNQLEEVTKPISPKTQRQMKNPIPGSSFSWSTQYTQT